MITLSVLLHFVNTQTTQLGGCWRTGSAVCARTVWVCFCNKWLKKAIPKFILT